MKPSVLITLVLLALVLTPLPGSATEKFALDTGHDCNYCHLDPAGGGELTAAGQAYRAEAVATGDVDILSAGSKILRFCAGYLHLIFAVFWFGTILYVHIVLKPSYAEKGLPRGEKFVGILSFWVVGITGLILAHYRIDSWQTLFDTRFGILLTIKVALYLTMLFSAILVIRVIGPRLARREVKKEHIPGQPFTRETLQAFNGKEGKPCYFAYRGKVYDAGDSKMWAGGGHMRRHEAGLDLTDDLPLAPHDEAVLTRLPVVGDFIAQDAGNPDTPTRIFYFVAHMNLGIVFLILLIIALWRWG